MKIAKILRKKIIKNPNFEKRGTFWRKWKFWNNERKNQKSYNLKNKKILEKLVILNKIKKKLENKNFEKNERFEKIAISKDMKNWDIWNIEYFRKQKILKK